MNIQLLREVQKAIKAHPDQFQMADWYSASLDTKERVGGCGTAACIGGWAIHLHWKHRKIVTTKESAIDHPLAPFAIARNILKLDEVQGDRLFIKTNWPDKFWDKAENARTEKDYAAAAIARIDHFIKTKGAE